jgi:hypothetical protein
VLWLSKQLGALSTERRDGMKNYFYVEIAASPYLFEKIVVVGGEYKFYAFYVDSGHPVADEKSRGRL